MSFFRKLIRIKEEKYFEWGQTGAECHVSINKLININLYVLKNDYD